MSGPLLLIAALEYAPAGPPAPPDPAGLVLRLALLVVGLLVTSAAVVWFARRTSRTGALKGDAGGRLRHEGSLPLDRRSAVHLVQVDGQTVAVTTDGTGLRSLVLLSEPFEVPFEAVGLAEVPNNGGPSQSIGGQTEAR